MKLTFVKPIRWMIDEGEQYVPSIITYTHYPIMMVSGSNNYPVKEKHWLYVNLWLVEIVHTWTTVPKELTE